MRSGQKLSATVEGFEKGVKKGREEGLEEGKALYILELLEDGVKPEQRHYCQKAAWCEPTCNQGPEALYPQRRIKAVKIPTNVTVTPEPQTAAGRA